MFCTNCFEAIPDGSEICPICGAKQKNESNEKAVVYASQAINSEKTSQPSKGKKRIIAYIAIFFIIVLVALIATLTIGHIVSNSQKAKLKEQLIGEWYIPDGSVAKVLVISDDKMEYKLETSMSWLNTSVGRYDWKVTNKNTIEIDQFGYGYKPHTVKLSDDKKKMTITPAITSTDALETWYLDD